MEPVSQLLKRARQHSEMTLKAFAEHLGVSETTYRNYEYGYSKRVPKAVRSRAEEILAGAPDVGPPAIPASQLQIPIRYIGFVSASAPVDWTDPFETETFEFVPSEMGDIKGRFACRVASDSCYDVLWPQDLCVFQSDNVPRLGCFVLWRMPDDRITIKQLKHDGKDYVLHPINAKYEDTTAVGTQVGFLVGIVRESGSRRMTIYDATGIRP